MYSEPPTVNISDTQNENTVINWPQLADKEVKEAICTFSSKKAPGPDGISFAIIQKAYEAIPQIFNQVYSQLIKAGYHLKCWRQGTEVILKKPGKPDYSKPKAYRIITLLNCLGKVAEKIMTTRLSYLGQITDLLDCDQTEGRKQMSAIDAVLALTHDIESARNRGEVLSCLLLDVKGAFDHVSLNQLLQILKKLQLSKEVQN